MYSFPLGGHKISKLEILKNLRSKVFQWQFKDAEIKHIPLYISNCQVVDNIIDLLRYKNKYS